MKHCIPFWDGYYVISRGPHTHIKAVGEQRKTQKKQRNASEESPALGLRS